MKQIWAIILAAGASTRMKRQKLLLPFGDKSIIETVIDNAMFSVDKNILVVLGANKEEIISRIGNRPVKSCVNKNFTDGMLSSIIVGFKALPKDASAALIFLGDQPQIPQNAAKNVIEAWKKNNKGIIIPTYKGRRGHPSLIETRYIPEIENLNPEKGLRSLFRKFENDVLNVECNFAEILRDIDTPEEYKLEMNKFN